MREKALEMRSAGYSYQLIKEKLGLSKGTLSNWLNDIPFVPNAEVLKRVSGAKLKSALHKQKQKFEDIKARKQEATREIGKISLRDLLMVGIGLYLGEGSKAIEEVKVVNSDPLIIRLAMKWFEKSCKVDRKHFRIRIHGYPDTDPRAAKEFWSKTLNISPEYFVKTIVDKRRNKKLVNSRKLPYGTAHLYIRGNGTLSRGVRSLHRKIMGLIESTVNQI